MSVDPATLKPGDRIRCYGGSHGREATVLAVDGDDLWARWADDGGGGTFVTYAFATHLELVPPPPLIDPEQVWCLSYEGQIYRDFPTAPKPWPRFRITQIEVVE